MCVELVTLFVSIQEASLRPDISYSVVQPPGGVQDFRLPVPSSSHVDYSSPWLCRISLQAMSGPSQPSPSAIPPPLSISDQNEVVDIGDEGGPKSVPPPLTTVQVGVSDEEEEEGGSGGEWPGNEDDEVVVVPVETYEAVGEEEMETTELPDFCFLNNEKGKTFLNILNPDIGTSKYGASLGLLCCMMAIVRLL